MARTTGARRSRSPRSSTARSLSWGCRRSSCATLVKATSCANPGTSPTCSYATAPGSIGGSVEENMMSRVLRLILAAIVTAALVIAIWSARFRYDHIVVDGDHYLVRIHRVTGHVDILIPGDGWVPAEEAWSDEEPGPDSTS